MDMLAIALWLGALGGVSAMVVGVVVPARRRTALLTAAVLFLPIGVLGILSVGAVFLLLALGCLVAAIRSHDGGSPRVPPAPV